LSKEILYEEVGKQCIIFQNTAKESTISLLKRGGYRSPASSKNLKKNPAKQKADDYFGHENSEYFFKILAKCLVENFFCVFASFRSIYFFYTIWLQSKNILFP